MYAFCVKRPYILVLFNSHKVTRSTRSHRKKFKPLYDDDVANDLSTSLAGNAQRINKLATVVENPSPLPLGTVFIPLLTLRFLDLVVTAICASTSVQVIKNFLIKHLPLQHGTEVYSLLLLR